jgi:hypothetical protein
VNGGNRLRKPSLGLRRTALRTDVRGTILCRMSPRRANPNSQTRREIAGRLRDRRVREETLILEAGNALAARSEAESAVSRANDALRAALSELEQLGFQDADVAALLGIEPSELNAVGSPRRSSARSSSVTNDSGGAAAPG